MLEHAAEIYHLREPEKLLLVMSADEIKRLLAVAGTLRRAFCSVSAMAADCGPSEVVRLKVKHIDSARC